MSQSVRVLVVDDSAFMRYTIAKHLEADPEVTVVGTAQDGLDALTKILALTPDVVTLDVEMPRMDGLTALKRIMVDCPTPVVMLSSLTKRGAQTTVQALMRGAVDFVAKPTASTDMRGVVEELAKKVKTAAKARPATPNGAVKVNRQKPVAAATTPPPKKAGGRPFEVGDPVVVIGTSTGGPRALHQVLSDLPAGFPAAVVIVQHMPAGFTHSLAQRLNEASALEVREAINGDPLALGLALVAPGDFHLRFGPDKQVNLTHGPRRHHVRPSVDEALESAIEYHKPNVIGVILTGMGSDGAEGAGAIKAAGGQVIAEHESTTVVYGMPRSVVEAGFADHIVPLPEVAATLVKLVKHGNSDANSNRSPRV